MWKLIQVILLLVMLFTEGSFLHSVNVKADDGGYGSLDEAENNDDNDLNSDENNEQGSFVSPEGAVISL